jgi:preprotein translocase subunit Sec63
LAQKTVHVRCITKPVLEPYLGNSYALPCMKDTPASMLHYILTMQAYRWRKLEGSDPNTFEMIQKIQTLQKRLITKTEEVVERDLLIQEKEKLYVELKNILARQPGPEVAEQLSTYQANIREKNKQMKSMASELNTHQAQVRLH